MEQLTEVLNPIHRKMEFSCGKDILDKYLHQQANQDIKRKLTVCFVLTDSEIIKGYYTISNNSISQEIVPPKLRRKLPNSYTSIPVTLLGRLAIDKKFQRKGIGKILLIDALKRCYIISKSIGSFAVIVDPLDNDAENYYEKFGFIKLPDSGKMFLSMITIKSLFK
ncbi:MAG: GNAT family N-acetyltransferase [Bacteroidota bacterium]|nr:GNAT family N-acetyltransferase [Bacteroidota bacterium]